MFTEGQEVWCAIYGAGIVRRIRQQSGVKYPVVVLFNSNNDDDDFVVTYTADGKYHVAGNTTLFTYPVEITKAVTKPSIDWSHVSSEYGYLFQDSDGEGRLCLDKPSRIESGWNVGSHYIYANPFTSYKSGSCDWKDSLVKRPD